MYPVTIPDPRWLYICQAYATSRTPTLIMIGQTGIIPTDKIMLRVEIELNGILLNGNPIMQAFYSWVRSYRQISPAADSFDYFVQ